MRYNGCISEHEHGKDTGLIKPMVTQTKILGGAKCQKELGMCARRQIRWWRRLENPRHAISSSQLQQSIIDTMNTLVATAHNDRHDAPALRNTQKASRDI